LYNHCHVDNFSFFGGNLFERFVFMIMMYMCSHCLSIKCRFVGLTICGVDCLLSAEWKSPNKIIARTGQARGTGDIIVVTRSGGVGSTTVQFRGYNIQIGNVV